MSALVKLRQSVELPLLVKELNEQAARPRTYVVRFVYASTLFAAACAMFYGGILTGGGGSADVFGRGRVMFQRLVTFQFWSIYLFLPAVSCGALTIEKERNTLGLLLITSLRPWQIVLQKVLGCVLPMITYVLLSFPLMAVAYSFGGVTNDFLWAGVILLLLTCLYVGALSVACSAYFTSTVEAFMAAYVLLLLLGVLNPLAWGPHLFENAAGTSLLSVVRSVGVMLFLTGCFLGAACAALESRAFVPPRNVMLKLFHRLDTYFNEANKVTGGIVLVRDGDPLPKTKPVAWRETAKKSLGTFRYLFRVLVVVEVPLLFICQSLRLNGPGGANLEPIRISLYLLWLLAAAMTVVHAGSLIAAERTRQTLDVLLTTPLSGRQILLEKMQGVRRLFGVVLVPFATIFLFEIWWNQSATYRWRAPLLGLASVFVYLPLVAWFSLWVGLRIRSQMKTVLLALTLIGCWLAVPGVTRLVVANLPGGRSDGLVSSLLLLNPAALIPAIEAAGEVIIEPMAPVASRPPPPPWPWFAANLVLHGAALWALRRHVLQTADRLLGRLEEQDLTAAQPSAAEFEPTDDRRVGISRKAAAARAE